MGTLEPIQAQMEQWLESNIKPPPALGAGLARPCFMYYVKSLAFR